MGKSTNIYVKIGLGSLEQKYAECICEADENDLRVLTALLLASDGSGKVNASVLDIAESMAMSEDSVLSGIKFWRGAGIVSSSATKSGQATKDEPAEPKPTKKRVYAHRDGVRECGEDVADYNTVTLTQLMERQVITSEFLNEAQGVLGKTFNTYDSRIAAGIIDRLGFEPETVLTILSYCAFKGKRSLRYAEKIALSLYDRELMTIDEVYDSLCKSESDAQLISKIKNIFGMGSRALSSGEKKLFEKWINEYGFDIDIIQKAYDITIDTIHKPDPKYTNGILLRWYESGAKTLAEIEEYDAKRKAEYTADAKPDKASRKGAGKPRDKSYDLDEFFEASLIREFEDVT